MALLHDGASRKRDIGMARAATQYDRPSLGKTVRLAHIPAFETRKPVRPPQVLKVSCAGCVIGEYPLKCWERCRKSTGIHDRNLASDYLIGNKPDRQGSNEHGRPTGHSRSQHGESGSCATPEVSRRLKHSVAVKRCRRHRSMDGEHVFATAGAMSYRHRALCRCLRHRHSSILGR